MTSEIMQRLVLVFSIISLIIGSMQFVLTGFSISIDDIILFISSLCLGIMFTSCSAFLFYFYGKNKE